MDSKYQFIDYRVFDSHDEVKSFVKALEKFISPPKGEKQSNSLDFFNSIFNRSEDENSEIKQFLLRGLNRNKNLLPLVSVFRSAVLRNNAQAILFEYPYLDLEFLENYKSVYSTSFKKYEKHCLRIHFFSQQIKENLKSFLNGERDTFCKEEDYLGFTTLRPLNSFIVGRTAIKFNKSPNEALDANRLSNSKPFLKGSQNIKVNVLGQTVNIDSVPFIQQDPSVGVCAPTSVWVAEQILKARFDTDYHSIDELTKKSYTTGKQESPIFSTVCHLTI